MLNLAKRSVISGALTEKKKRRNYSRKRLKLIPIVEIILSFAQKLARSVVDDLLLIHRLSSNFNRIKFPPMNFVLLMKFVPQFD